MRFFVPSLALFGALTAASPVIRSDTEKVTVYSLQIDRKDFHTVKKVTFYLEADDEPGTTCTTSQLSDDAQSCGKSKYSFSLDFKASNVHSLTIYHNDFGISGSRDIPTACVSRGLFCTQTSYKTHIELG